MAALKKLIFSFINVGIGLIILSLIATGIFLVQDNKLNTWLEKIPVLSGETALRDALGKEPAIYLLKDMVVTGETCSDYLDILADSYIYLSYQKFEYRDVGTTKHRDREWMWLATKEQKAPQLIFFNNIKVEPGDYSAYCPYLDLATAVKPEYAAKVVDPDQHGYIYYPAGSEERLGNIRYEISGLPVGCKIMCVAEVGNGTVKLISYKKGEPPAIAGDNDMSKLTYELDEGNAGMAALGMVAFPCGIAFIIFDFVRRKKYVAPQK